MVCDDLTLRPGMYCRHRTAPRLVGTISHRRGVAGHDTVTICAHTGSALSREMQPCSKKCSLSLFVSLNEKEALPAFRARIAAVLATVGNGTESPLVSDFVRFEFAFLDESNWRTPQDGGTGRHFRHAQTRTSKNCLGVASLSVKNCPSASGENAGNHHDGSGPRRSRVNS